jgi:hypothetical protein
VGNFFVDPFGLKVRREDVVEDDIAGRAERCAADPGYRDEIIGLRGTDAN